MKRRKIFSQLPNLDNSVLPGDFLLVILSILVVLVATLSPFNFSFPDTFSLPELVASFDNSSFFKDQVNNILLFAPLGLVLPVSYRE
jgi:p-aminobenzoyl-glutamate transporter AbgT